MSEEEKQSIFFPNLLVEMKREGISQNRLAVLSGINHWSLCRKMCGKNDFTLSDMRKIQKVFPNCTLDYLFIAETKKE